MGCDFPVKAYRSEERSPTGKRLLTFNPLRAINSSSPMLIPCNRCTGCRLERARQWAVRLTHESKLYDDNCFLTLTYDDQHVPQDYGLDLRHWQLFMKRLRKRAKRKRIRFFACGEYGDILGRPHYHAIVLNYDFADKKPVARDEDNIVYTSQLLEELWGMGGCTTQDVTFKSCGYVARYALKKINGGREADHYYRVSPIDGQAHSVRPEFAVMSRKPGIGLPWLKLYKADVFPSGFIVANGVPQAPPKYYVSQLKEEEQEALKRQARRRSLKHKQHNTMERRWAKVAVRDDRIKTLKRKLEG